MHELKVLISQGFPSDPLEHLEQTVELFGALEAAAQVRADSLKSSSDQIDRQDRHRELGLISAYHFAGETAGKLLAEIEAAFVETPRAAEILALHLLNGSSPGAWARLKAHIDGICSAEDCDEEVAGVDPVSVGDDDLRHELCPDHLAAKTGCETHLIAFNERGTCPECDLEILHPIFVASGLLPDDVGNLAAIDRSSSALASEGYGRDFYR